MRTILLFAILFLVTGVAASHAQSRTCKNRVFIDSVYQTGMGGNNYEYHLQIRNGTNQPIHWDLDFRNLPKGVTVFSPHLSSGSTMLHPYSNQTIRFGRGTNGNINTGTVTVGYDKAGANVVVSNCH